MVRPLASYLVNLVRPIMAPRTVSAPLSGILDVTQINDDIGMISGILFLLSFSLFLLSFLLLFFSYRIYHKHCMHWMTSVSCYVKLKISDQDDSEEHEDDEYKVKHLLSHPPWSLLLTSAQDKFGYSKKVQPEHKVWCARESTALITSHSAIAPLLRGIITSHTQP